MNDDIEFEYGDGTLAYGGCGATLFGQFWYFGGSASSYYRQVWHYQPFSNHLELPMIENVNLFKASKIEGCTLVRQQDLPFDHYYGSCKTFLQPTERVLLCFDYSQNQVCHT